MLTKTTRPPRPNDDSVNSFDEIRSSEKYSKVDRSVPCAHTLSAGAFLNLFRIFQHADALVSSPHRIAAG